VIICIIFLVAPGKSRFGKWIRILFLDVLEVSTMKRNFHAGIELNAGLSLNILTDDEVE